MLNFDVVTLFPQLIEPHLKELPFKRAIEKDALNVRLHQLREYAIDKHGTVDDKPYGGGVGMILRVEPIFDALSDIYKTKRAGKSRVVVLTPAGSEYSQSKAREYSELDQITFVCGRYEGIDARIMEFEKLLGVEVEPISIGKYVLSGGEIPALAIMESTVRLLPGILEKEDAAEIESFSELHNIEYPQFTRPDDFKGLKVPEVLLSGNHKQIEDWRKIHSK